MKWDRYLSKIGLALIALMGCICLATVSHAQSPPSGVKVLHQGEEIIFNGDRLPISWRQWEANGKTHLGISDTAAQQRLGLELLSSNNPQVQPVWWFGGKNNSAYRLSTQHLQGNRYLDLTPILRATAQQLSVSGNQLEIVTTPAQVQNIRLGKQAWGERIVVDLDRPLLWHLKEGRDQATLTLPAVTPSQVSEQFPPPPTITEEMKATATKSESALLVVQPSVQQTELEVNLPEALNLRVSTLANPPRLVIDLRPDNIQSKHICWAQGIDWRQDYIATPDGTFAVQWLELDPQAGNWHLIPIWTNPEQMQGIDRLTNTGKENQVPIAINGGFFNRDTQLPLGAIKREGQWYSSPILNRGAIAWDNQGQMVMDRLRYEETLRTRNGQTFSLQALNSGYVQSGIARYTPAWGVTYTPLTDGETVVVVENERVQQLVTGNRSQPIPIPSHGYLLTIRKKSELVSAFQVETSLQLNSQSFPNNFDRYPHILAAGPLLMKNGRVVLDAAGENFSRAFINQKAHRSAIALTQQGKLLLIAMGDGVGRKGPTLAESTAILKRLGAVEALNLDGGSSTSLYLGGELINRSPATSARIHNGIGVYRVNQ